MRMRDGMGWDGREFGYLVLGPMYGRTKVGIRRRQDGDMGIHGRLRRARSVLLAFTIGWTSRCQPYGFM